MKTPYVIGLVVAAVLVTVAIEETRMSRLKSETVAAPSVSRTAAPTETSLPAAAVAGSTDAPLKTKRERPDPEPAEVVRDEGDDDSMARTVRKMWDNPAGKAMMNQGVKIAVAMMYEDFIKTMDFTDEEADYFKGLLGGEIAAQQELGMKMMSASPEERLELADELEERRKENDESIRKFLNNDEDYQAYQDYKDRTPERQQLEGVRAAMQAKGAPLDADTEARLVEAMYDARKNAGTGDFSGPDALKEMSNGNMTKAFEENWQRQDEAVTKRAAEILNADQLEAFREFRGQMKEMQLMGLKMAEKMMGGKDEAE